MENQFKRILRNSGDKGIPLFKKALEDAGIATVSTRNYTARENQIEKRTEFLYRHFIVGKVATLITAQKS